ncbi:MAG: hypothetical protein Q8P16_00930, partial [bacterium]|nr:hypothetical protein [bacterium]
LYPPAQSEAPREAGEESEQTATSSTEADAQTVTDTTQKDAEFSKNGMGGTTQGAGETAVSSKSGGAATTGQSEQEDSAVSQLVIGVENTNTPTTVELGPRQRADSAASALAFFAEAMVANDYERAASYFSANVRDSYRASFEGQNGAQHAVVRAYYGGTVEDVQLVDPKYGIYEIAVYPAGSPLPFRPRFAYNAEAGEYVILEL